MKEILDENQIFLIDKPAGMSSFGVVAKVRGWMKAKFGHKVKVGHTGTLDPFATGLLIVLTGKMTKRSEEFLKKDKVYIATMRLGATSTTGDPEGELTKRSERVPTLDEVKEAARKFTGKIRQKVPQFSAVKINGERAYKLARAGKEFTTPTREVEVYSLEVLGYDYPEVRISCHVSSGTYIRTLAEDIGEALGVGAYLTELRRTQIAGYKVEEAMELGEL